MNEQNFANHEKFVPLFHAFVIPVLVINLGCTSTSFLNIR
jgi:Family of unknown function (DUF6526)